MERLLLASLKLANEVKLKNTKIFNELEQSPQACFALITELQSRVTGYELNDYVKAMTHAIKNHLNE